MIVPEAYEKTRSKTNINNKSEHEKYAEHYSRQNESPWENVIELSQQIHVISHARMQVSKYMQVHAPNDTSAEFDTTFINHFLNQFWKEFEWEL